MTEMAERSSSLRKEKNIGLLFVHGIGEQMQFEHLETEARNIITALQATDAPNGLKRRVRVEINVLPGATYSSEQEIWQTWEEAPIVAEVIDENPESSEISITRYHFYQVWWADLDEPTSIRSTLNFWLWGLSLWRIQKTDSNIGLGSRVRLFLVASILLLVSPVLGVLRILSKGLGLPIPRPDILVDFVGDVKLYQQSRRIGKGPLRDIGKRPRLSIRRRMYQAIVRMALNEKLDCWYILAHSQGTVIAFNGLMEDANTFPNFLTPQLWAEAVEKNLVDLGSKVSILKGDDCPVQPSWSDLHPIDRRKLFEKLDGVVTYGSPLKKFANLWPDTVKIGQNTRTAEAFNKKFTWLNIYDPSDPISDPAFDEFGPFRQGFPLYLSREKNCIDIAYMTDGFHILSHLKYLTVRHSSARDDSGRRLVNQIIGWINSGDSSWSSFENALSGKITGSVRSHNRVRLFSSFVIAITIGSLLGILLGAFIPALLNSLPDRLIKFDGNWFIATRSSLISWISDRVPGVIKGLLASLYIGSFLVTFGAFIFSRLREPLVFFSSFLVAVPILQFVIFPALGESNHYRWLIRVLLEGAIYIAIAAAIASLIGTFVWLFVRDRENL